MELSKSQISAYPDPSKLILLSHKWFQNKMRKKQDMWPPDTTDRLKFSMEANTMTSLSISGHLVVLSPNSLFSKPSSLEPPIFSNSILFSMYLVTLYFCEYLAITLAWSRTTSSVSWIRSKTFNRTEKSHPKHPRINAWLDFQLPDLKPKKKTFCLKPSKTKLRLTLIYWKYASAIMIMVKVIFRMKLISNSAWK